MALSYEDTVLATNPTNYWRLKEVIGPTMADIGSAPVDGTYFDDAVFGRPGPIETDSSAFAVGNRVGISAALASVDNFSFAGWTYFDPDNISASGIICRNGQIGSSGSNMLTIDHGLGQIGARLNPHANPFEFFDLSFPLTTPGWYWVAVTRNDTVVTLLVNDAIADQRSDFPSGPMTNPSYIDGGGFGWKVGVTGDSGNVFGGTRTAEAVVWDYPITLAQFQAIYEAAFNALFLNGQSNVIPTATLSSLFEPDPVSYPFRHNWSEALVERLSFLSATSTAVTGIEEGVAEREAPRREIEWTQVVRDDRERRRLRALLWANQHRKWFIPVRQYAEKLVEGLSAGATITPISTAWKDYEIGLWIGFRQLSSSGEIEHWEERLITSLNPNSVEHDPLTNDYAAHRSLVYPVRRGLLRAQISAKGYTDAVEEISLTARLLPEDESLIPNRITSFSPAIKYRDVEIFDGRVWQSNDWSEQREYEIQRAGEEVDFEAGVIGFESDTVGASETFSYRMVLEGIEQIAAFLGWYYERMGALRYLWVPSMQRDFEVVSINLPEHQITVRDTNYSDAYVLAEARRDLAFVYWNGTVVTRRVIAFEVSVGGGGSGSEETLRLDAAVPTTTNLRMISLLKYCRLDADQLELAWETDDKVVVAWRFREQLHTPEGEGVSSLSPSSSQSISLSPSGSASPSGSVSLSPSPSGSLSPSASVSPSSSGSPSHSASLSPSGSTSPSASTSPSHSPSPST